MQKELFSKVIVNEESLHVKNILGRMLMSYPHCRDVEHEQGNVWKLRQAQDV